VKTREASPVREAARAILEAMPGWRFLEPERKERLLERNATALEAAVAKQREINRKGQAK
jgi:hypothetical protein